MDRRLTLQERLEQVPTIKAVYFQPPENIRMEYPCIRYYRVRPSVDRANDKVYRYTQCYELIVIDPDPDSQVAEYIATHFPMAEVNTTYASNDLYHTSITLYY